MRKEITLSIINRMKLETTYRWELLCWWHLFRNKYEYVEMYTDSKWLTYNHLLVIRNHIEELDLEVML